MSGTIELVQSCLLIISSIMLILVAIGLFRLNKDIKNVVYARIHIFGLFDIAVIIAFIGLGEFLLAGIYFLLSPLIMHALANAYYNDEDDLNNVNLRNNGDNDDSTENNPFIHPISKLKQLDKEEVYEKTSESVLVSTIETKEDE